MKEIRKINSGGLYLFQGEASANSVFIQDKTEALEFMEKCVTRFEGYLEIKDYLLTKGGWVLLVQICAKDQIFRTYLANRKNSKRAKASSKLDEVWKIISEQMRCQLSQFVKYTNKKQGRTGGKVKESYKKYLFESIEEAEVYVNEMRSQKLKLRQGKRTYRGKSSHYQIRKRKRKGAYYLCSKLVRLGEEVGCFGIGCMKLLGDSYDILRTLVNFTISIHNLAKPPSSFPKVE